MTITHNDSFEMDSYILDVLLKLHNKTFKKKIILFTFIFYSQFDAYASCFLLEILNLPCLSRKQFDKLLTGLLYFPDFLLFIYLFIMPSVTTEFQILVLIM
jgi:hypothetical protein